MPENRLNILLIADVESESQHSSVEGLFKSRQGIGVCCYKLFFDKSVKAPLIQPDRAILPHKYRRRGLVNFIQKNLTLNRYHAIVVRNLFSVLAQILCAGLPIPIGFWESFPHSYRRLEQAQQEKRALYRKRWEYFWAARRERSFLRRCDFYLPITETHKLVYYPDLSIPYFPTPMGFDFERYNARKTFPQSGPPRFVYIGAIDSLRRFDIINNAFLAQDKDFLLDYYSFNLNEMVDRIRSIRDPRIRFQGALPRDELFSEISKADIGICFFPHTKTYITASPTKTIEYGALGLTVLVNPMPEYQSLLDNSCAFICDFEEDAINQKVKEILAKDRQLIIEMGYRLKQRVLKQRNYSNMAEQLFSFIRKQCQG